MVFSEILRDYDSMVYSIQFRDKESNIDIGFDSDKERPFRFSIYKRSKSFKTRKFYQNIKYKDILNFILLREGINSIENILKRNDIKINLFFISGKSSGVNIKHNFLIENGDIKYKTNIKSNSENKSSEDDFLVIKDIKIIDEIKTILFDINLSKKEENLFNFENKDREFSGSKEKQKTFISQFLEKYKPNNYNIELKENEKFICLSFCEEAVNGKYQLQVKISNDNFKFTGIYQEIKSKYIVNEILKENGIECIDILINNENAVLNCSFEEQKGTIHSFFIKRNEICYTIIEYDSVPWDGRINLRENIKIEGKNFDIIEQEISQIKAQYLKYRSPSI